MIPVTRAGPANAAPQTMPNTLERLRIIPSGAALAADVAGVDFSRRVPDEIKEALRQAWAEHLVLRIRDQHLDDDAFLEVARIFGETKASGTRELFLKAGMKVDNKRLSANPHIGIVSNVDAEGKPVMDNGGLGSYELTWHSDNSHSEVPPAGSMLYALELPVNGGGDTWFNNQYRAWEELPRELKDRVQGKWLLHDASRNSAGVLRPTAKAPTCREEVQGPKHPLVRVHPVTQKPALYLGRRREWPSSNVIGLPDDESEALLDALWRHATQPKYAWVQTWRVGDVVLWDNRCCMHYRTEIDSAQRRVLHRTVIAGEPVIAAQ